MGVIWIQRIFFIITFIALMYSDANADIYKYIDENGTIHFTNAPNGNNYKKIISEDRTQSNFKSQSARTIDYQQVLETKSKEYNMESSLIKAVIKTESDWDTVAVSKKGAMGLMQLMPATARDMDVENPFDPEENIEGGIKYLRYLLNKFNGDLSLALAAYNAGPKIVERFRGIPPIPETKNYVKRILSLYNANGSNSSEAPTIIYKVIHNDGTVLYTNTPLLHENYKPSKF